MLCDSTYVRPREQSNTQRGKENRGYGVGWGVGGFSQGQGMRLDPDGWTAV